MNNIYVILDRHYNRIGTLDLAGATPFSNDSITIQLADADSTSTDFTTALTPYDTNNNDVNINSKDYNHYGSITVAQGYPDSDKVVVGNHLAYYDENSHHWYIMRIYYTSETGSDISGRHTTTAQLENIALFDLGNRIPEVKTMKMASLDNALGWLLQNSQWEIVSSAKSALTADVSFDGKASAWESLQTILQLYDVELDCYVVIDSGSKITRKVIEVTDRLNSDEIYQEATFGKNITEVTRNIVEAQVVTKLYVYGAQGDSIRPVNDGKAYLVDDAANELYNADYKNSYREKSITAGGILNRAALMEWGKRMLKLYNHPRYNYTVTMSNSFNPPIGVTIRVKDWYMSPELTVESRVIQKTFSKANPFGNTIVLGEFVTVHAISPSWLATFETNMLSAIAAAKKDASSVKPVALTPDGNNFTDSKQTKRLILQAWEGNTNISAYIDNKGFIWRRHNMNGTVDSSYKSTGYLINAAENAVGTLHGTIETDYVQDDPEIKLNTDGVKYLGVYGPDDNGAHSATQYLARLSNGQFISSRARDSSGSRDVMFALQDDKFAVQSVMLQVHGQHGGTFGVQEVNNTVYIWNIVSLKNDHDYILVRFPYLPGVTLQPTDKRVQQIMTLKGYGRINYDRQHDMVSIGYNDGSTDILNASDLLAGNYNVLYNFNITDYGIDFNQNTYQSECLDFPYFYFAAGGGQETNEDPHKVWALNVVHKGAEFEVYLDNDLDFPNLTDENREVETCNVFYQNGQPYMLFTFNTNALLINPASMEREKVYTIPMIKRSAVSVIDKGTISENDNTAD